MPTTEDPWEASDAGGRHRLRASASPLFGIDAHPQFQAGLLIEELPAAGFGFLSVKVSEGTAAYPSDFIPRGLAAGLVCAGYHYLHAGNEDTQAQVFAAQLAANGNVAGVIDAEAIDSTGTPTLTVAGIKLFLDRCRYHGANVQLLYLPRWWWQRLGSPDLSTLGLPLWASSYPSTALGTAQQLYAAVTPGRWTAYAGLPVALLQFAETGLVPGAQADLNAFLGTRDQLATLLGIHTDPPPTETIRMRQLHLTNTGADLADLSGVLTIDPVGISDVMPAGSHAWIQWSGACVRNTAAKAHVWWMVERHADGTSRAINPFDVAHGQSAAFELSQGTVAVEIGLERVPPGFTFAAHLDGIGHA